MTELEIFLSTYFTGYGAVRLRHIPESMGIGTIDELIGRLREVAGQRNFGIKSFSTLQRGLEIYFGA